MNIKVLENDAREAARTLKEGDWHGDDWFTVNRTVAILYVVANAYSRIEKIVASQWSLSDAIPLVRDEQVRASGIRELDATFEKTLKKVHWDTIEGWLETVR